MRRIDGWYPSVGDYKALAPRASPTDWLVALDAVEPNDLPMVPVSVDDELDFDHWVPNGSATMYSGGEDGDPEGFRVGPGEPVSWGVCRNPLRADLNEFVTLAAFAAYWLSEDRTAVGIEFGTWTLGVPYVVEEGPVATPV